MIERWKPVVGYEELYEVSDHGRVRSLPRRVRTRSGTRTMGGQLLAATASRPDGRRDVSLCDHGARRTALVAHLVLEAFVGPRPLGKVGCHDNDVPHDDVLTNLRWGTQASNLLDRSRNGHDPQRAKDTCPIGHRLDEPNLVASKVKLGHRVCLACARARAYLQRHPELDFELVARDYYDTIMGLTSVTRSN